MIELRKINKNYYKNGKQLKIFDNLYASFEPGKFYAIIGKSGAGKSTLINIIGLLDTFQNGEYLIDNKIIENYDDVNLSRIRMNKIGIIFQDYYLNPRLTAYENVLIATLINDRIKTNDRKKIITSYFKKLGIEDRMNHYPEELSGGEQQRVCIARALVNNPTYILADEPTGSLDPENVDIIINILKDLRDEGKCIIMVTHDMTLIDNADCVYNIVEGNLVIYK